MAVPAKLLQQLLALDEAERLELAHTLLESVDGSNDGMSESEREQLDAALERSIAQADAGQTVSFGEVMAALRAKRTGAAR